MVVLYYIRKEYYKKVNRKFNILTIFALLILVGMSSCNKEEALTPVEQKTAEMTYRNGDDEVEKEDDSDENGGITVTGEEGEDDSDDTAITVTGGEGEDDSDDKGGITTTGDEDEEEEESVGKKGSGNGSTEEDRK